MLTTVRTRLTLLSVGISVLVLLLLFVVSYLFLGQFLESNSEETTRHNLQIALDNLDRDVGSLRQLLSWISVSDEVQELAAAPRDAENQGLGARLAAYATLRAALYGNPLYSQINKILLVDRAGRSIQMGSTPGHFTDAARARAEAETGTDHLVVEPFEYGSHQPVVILSHPIVQAFTGDTLGWVCVALNTAEVTQYLSNYTYFEGVETFLVVGSTVLALDVDQRRFVPSRLPASGFQTPDDKVKMVLDGARRTVVVGESKSSGWRLAQSVVLVPRAHQDEIYALLFGFVVFALGMLVVALLSLVDRTIHRPIGLIQKRLALVAGGDFRPDPAIEFPNELGNIGRGINHLCQNIEELIASRLKDEATKKDLEVKMLQNQINPHFLYNTLNSIKWMAEIQGSQGIVEMVGALATLLKHVAKGTEELVPLSQELELVRQFALIQNYRTGGLVTLKIVVEDPALEPCSVFKFTLQPLVENAVHHGIEPTGRPGTVVVHCYGQEDNLVIDVTDDGVGVAPDRLAVLLTEQPVPDGKGFRSIGLKNVDERIRLRFGPGYGLTVQSEHGAFTRVSVRLPRRFPCTVS